jgi:hypothetical protein
VAIILDCHNILLRLYTYIAGLYRYILDSCPPYTLFFFKSVKHPLIAWDRRSYLKKTSLHEGLYSHLSMGLKCTKIRKKGIEQNLTMNETTRKNKQKLNTTNYIPLVFLSFSLNMKIKKKNKTDTPRLFQ